jgi:hypothetical protein
LRGLGDVAPAVSVVGSQTGTQSKLRSLQDT